MLNQPRGKKNLWSFKRKGEEVKRKEGEGLRSEGNSTEPVNKKKSDGGRERFRVPDRGGCENILECSKTP